MSKTYVGILVPKTVYNGLSLILGPNVLEKEIGTKVFGMLVYYDNKRPTYLGEGFRKL